MRKEAITPAVAARLIAEQFPQWADLPVGTVELDGTDNTTFRLGDELSVRLPSGDAYVAQVEKEHRWLPYLARQLPLPIPEPVAKGAPSEVFPRPWSVYRWLPGEPAATARIDDVARFAADLAAFLTALYAIDPAAGPAAGAHSFFRGGPLSVYDAEARTDAESEAARDVWDAAVATTWQRLPVWVHGDVTASNLLVRDGRLAAVIDFGCCAVGDPACDLTMAWTFFSGESRRVFRDRLALDAGTWARARGWALWKAQATLAKAVREGSDAAGRDVRRFGWRLGARDVVTEVLEDPL